LVSLLSRADAVVANHALGAVYGLRPPRTCLEPSSAVTAAHTPDAPPERLAGLRRAVAEAEALAIVAKCGEALEAASNALPLARSLPHPRSEADLELVIAGCKAQTEDATAARQGYERVLAAAEAAGDDALAAL